MTVARALILSPSASHPRDYGNRNRVWQTTRFLQAIGYEIHFVLYPIEDDWQNGLPASADEMRSAWSSFTIIPPSIKLHSRASGEYHTIDEWWDPQIEHYLSWLLARQRFNVMLVNYAFLSKAFELAPRTVVKVLETHDLFSGRKEMLGELEVNPEFFYTVPEQERIAFDRADIVVAIKDSEARHIAERTARQVVALPFFPDFVESKVSNAVAAPSPEVLRVGDIWALVPATVTTAERQLGFTVTPLRYVPGHLYSWNRGEIGDQIIVVLCNPSDQDMLALEILKHRFRKSRKVEVFGEIGPELGTAGGAILPEERLFGYLVGAGKPSRVVAIGRDRRKMRLYREFSRYTGIGFGRIACAELPYFSSLPGGQRTLCMSPNDAVNCACPLDADFAVPEMSDSRWEPYWDVILAKLRRSPPSGPMP